MAEIRLRGGFTTQDVRLDRLPELDERSRRFAVSDVLSRVELPSAKRVWGTYRWNDQGSLGGCVGWSWMNETNASPFPHGAPDDYARSVYFAAQRIDPWEGGEYPGAAPVYAGTSVLAGAKVVQGLGFMAEYRWAFSVEEGASAVVALGPAILGIPWHGGMMRARPEASFEVFPTGGVAGGHAILWRGFYPANAGIWNPVTGATFRFPYPVARLRNSWSRGWGMAGDCFVSIDNLRALLSDWGECCIPVGRRKVKPLPTVA